MALGILNILYIVLTITAVVIQILLYKSNDKSRNSKFIFGSNILLGLVVAFIAYTSLPSNFIVQKVLAATFGIIAVLSILIKQKAKQSLIISKAMLTISIVGSFIILFM